MDGVETLSDGRAVLKLRVLVAPEDGAANKAVRRLLSEALGRPASAISLVSGATARVKVFSLEGEPAALADALSRHLQRKRT